MVVGYVGENETVVPFDFGVRMAGGSGVCPILLQDDFQAFLIFLLKKENPTWDGTWVEVVRHDEPTASPIGIIHWKRCYAAVLSRPNTDVWFSHRLWRRGLKDVMQTRAGEVSNSAWIALLERLNSPHPNHNPAEYEYCRHFILLFHDSTFECIANGFTVETVVDSWSNVLARLFQQL